MIGVTVTTAATVQVSPPKELFQASAWTAGPMAEYSVAKDGSRFLMIEPFEDPRAETLTVIAHWSDTLQK